MDATFIKSRDIKQLAILTEELRANNIAVAHTANKPSKVLVLQGKEGAKFLQDFFEFRAHGYKSNEKSDAVFKTLSKLWFLKFENSVPEINLKKSDKLANVLNYIA